MTLILKGMVLCSILQRLNTHVDSVQLLSLILLFSFYSVVSKHHSDLQNKNVFGLKFDSFADKFNQILSGARLKTRHCFKSDRKVEPHFPGIFWMTCFIFQLLIVFLLKNSEVETFDNFVDIFLIAKK